MTREELKDILKSRKNKLAGEAIEAIRALAPVETLQRVVEAGAAQIFYKRDPDHPRSRFRTENVLDACFESSFGILSESTEERDGCTVGTATLGNVHRSEGRLPHFRYLLSKGFAPGINGYRGPLFQHILNSCFYKTGGEKSRDNARQFARALAEAKAFDIQNYAENNYAWVNDPEAVDFLVSLGADPKGPGMIDCALNYIGCSPNSGETPGARAAVVRKLLSLGAIPVRDLGRAISWQHIREALEAHGLLEEIATHGVIPLEPPQEFLDYLQRCGKPVPAEKAA